MFHFIQTFSGGAPMISIPKKQSAATDISLAANAAANGQPIDSESPAASRIARRRWLVRVMVVNLLAWIVIIVMVRLSFF